MMEEKNEKGSQFRVLLLNKMIGLESAVFYEIW